MPINLENFLKQHKDCLVEFADFHQLLFSYNLHKLLTYLKQQLPDLFLIFELPQGDLVYNYYY